MRELTLPELEIVSGGQDEEEESVQRTVVVTSDRDENNNVRIRINGFGRFSATRTTAPGGGAFGGNFGINFTPTTEIIVPADDDDENGVPDFIDEAFENGQITFFGDPDSDGDGSFDIPDPSNGGGF